MPTWGDFTYWPMDKLGNLLSHAERADGGADYRSGSHHLKHYLKLVNYARSVMLQTSSIEPETE